METEFRLSESRTVTIGSNGTAEVLGIGPSRAFERWVIKLFNVKTGSSGIFQVFRGYGTDNTNQIDYTGRADGDTSDCNIPLRTGESISIKWSACLSGATGIFRLEGSAFITGQRSY